MNLYGFFRKKDINEGVENFRKTAGALLIDVRSAEEYESGRIEGSINLPLSEIKNIRKITNDLAIPLFVYCLSGVRSAGAVSELKRMEYKNISDIGGICSYKRNIIS